MKNNKENQINYGLINELDEEWSLFLSSIPEQLGHTIADGNLIFEQKVKRWCVKMSLKYGFHWRKIKEKYYND